MTLKRRLLRLESARPAPTDTEPSGWDTFVWDGPKDDAALREAERAAEASNRGLIIVEIVDPPSADDRPLTSMTLGQ